MAHELEYIGGDTKQNSRLNTKTFILLEKKKTEKEQTKTKVKAKDVMVIRYRGNSPKLGTSQGDCPYPCLVVFLWR